MQITPICFIGSGHMANALIAGLLNNDYPPNQIWATRRSTDKLELLREQRGIHTTNNNGIAATQTDIWVLCVRPNDMQRLCEELHPVLAQRKQPPLIISVAAGIPADYLHAWLAPHAAIVRAMPNLPAIVGAGATALFSTNATPAQKTMVETIFRSVGLAVWVEDENHLDIITAAISSGSAYIFFIMDAIQNAAKSLGLPDEMARLLTCQLTLGASRLAMTSEKSFSELLNSVVTPQGVTDAAIQVFEHHDLRNIFKKAIEAGWQRTQSIAKHLKKE